MKRVRLAMTLGDTGGGTVTATEPVWGCVSEVRYNGGTAFIGLGTVAITRLEDGGTVLAGSTGNGTWSHAPVQPQVSRTLAAAGSVAPIPVDGYLRMTVTGGGSAASGTVDVYVH